MRSIEILFNKNDDDELQFIEIEEKPNVFLFGK